MRKNTNHGVVELEQVSFTWPGNQTPTLNIDSLSVQEGEHLFIKGPSGCGKSTLLGLLTGIQTIDTGKLRRTGRRLGTNVW